MSYVLPTRDTERCGGAKVKTETSDVQYWQPSCPRRSQEGVTRRGPHAVTPYQDASSRAVMSRRIVFLSVGTWRVLVLAVNCEVVALGSGDIEAVS